MGMAVGLSQVIPLNLYQFTVFNFSAAQIQKTKGWFCFEKVTFVGD